MVQMWLLQVAQEGWTAMVAAQCGHEAVTKLLLDHGADVAAAAKNGATALVLALASGHLAVAKLLVERDARVARDCRSSWTTADI